MFFYLQKVTFKEIGIQTEDLKGIQLKDSAVSTECNFEGEENHFHATINATQVIFYL